MDFERAKNSYRKNAVVQGQMAKKLVCLLMEVCGKKFERVFEIGAGTGFLTDEIRKNLDFGEIILNDLTDNFTNFKPKKYIKGDILKIELPEKPDLIISNAVFQWIEQPDLLFKKLKGAIAPGGILAFSTFGGKNFAQIKDITGVGLNYPDLDETVKNAGFETLYFEQSLETLYFKNPKEVLFHIKLTGVKTGDKFWTKSDYKNFEKRYLEKYSDGLGSELTYHPVYRILRG